MPWSISVTAENSAPIYRQIVDQVCAAVISERLVEGERLPTTTRGLAERLGLNPNTVAHAYHELQRQGVIESRGNKGVFVAPRRQRYTKPERDRRVDPRLTAFVSQALLLGFTTEEVLRQVEAKLHELSPPRRRVRRSSSG